MSTITKQAVQAVADLKAGYTLGHADVAILNELARIALASLEAEASGRNPVLAYADSYRNMANHGVESIPVWSVITDLERNIAPLFTAPPVPVSVPDYPETLPCPVTLEPGLKFGKGVSTRTMLGALQRRAEFHAELEAMTPEQRAEHDAGMKEFAAMLQGDDGKPELTVWYGSMPETNGKTNWTAILHRKGQQLWEGITIDRSEYPDRVRYEADRMRHLIGELADEPDILAYDADAHSGYVKPGNSSVIPDGWVLVPVEPTEDMIVNGFESEPDESFSDEKEWEVYDAMSGFQQAAHRAKLCWAAMIKAAPKLE